MNLKITLQTLWRIERLLDGWQSSGDIPAIERDLACDLLRRAYDDIFFSDKNAATASEASLAENTPADRMNEKAVGEVAGIPVAAGDALIADVVSPVGLVGLAPSGEEAEGMPEKSPENAEAVAEPAAEPAPIEVPAEEDTSAGTPVEESASVEESVAEPAAVGEPVEEDHPVKTSVGEVAEEEISVEEFGEAGEPGDAVEEPGDAVSSAEVVATSIPEASADIVIDPVFEVFTDEDEDENAEEPEDAEAVDLVETVNVVEAVEVGGAAEDTEIAEEVEVVEEMEAEETGIERRVAAPAAIRSVVASVEPAAEPGPESVLAPAPAETSVKETPADAAASNAETLEEMAARFKNASGRRRKSRRAFLSLYDDDETARRAARNDQLELSDWGVPSDPSAKLRHARELFGLPVDDLDTASEPAPQSEATDGEMEMEIVDFVNDDNLAQSNRNAEPLVKPATEPTSEPTAAPTQPTLRPTVAPAREERDDADDDLPFDEAVVALEDPDDVPSAVPYLEHLEHSESPDTVPFDSIEIVEITDVDEDVPEIKEDETSHTDRAEVADEPPAKSEIADPVASGTEPAAVRGLYGREEKSELPASTTVLGEVMGHDVPTVGDSLGRRPDVAGWTEVAGDLNHAISVGDRFVLLRDLFDGDQALCDRTLKRLSTFDDLDDCMIWITENFAWNANSEGAKLIMGLLERKLG